jgi:hypothetical protein
MPQSLDTANQGLQMAKEKTLEMGEMGGIGHGWESERALGIKDRGGGGGVARRSAGGPQILRL